MNPQDYSRRSAYRPPAAWYRRLNWLGALLASFGLAPREAVTLEVRGRRSGKLRRTPVLRTPHRGQDYLVALAGESHWVRNVRAAAGQAVIRRRGRHRVLLREIPPDERPQIISEYLRRGRERGGAEAAAKQARFYFGLSPDASPEQMRAVAGYYPVFLVVYAGRPAEPPGTDRAEG
jgi:deazaflavin-dependent oxidoreductase (nitroreductase family)